METKRIALWDNVKFILITLVVVGHFINEYTSFSQVYKSLYVIIYAFHMPLFLFVAGLFHKNKNIVQKVTFYLSLYVVLKIAYFALRVVFSGKVKFTLFTEGSLPWFAFAMAAFIVITYLLRNANKWFVLVFAIIIACFAGYDKDIGDFLVASRIIVFFPCYWLGTMVRREKLEELSAKKSMKLLGWVIIICWVILCLAKPDTMNGFRHLFIGKNPFHDSIRDYGALLRLACYIMTFFTSVAIILITPVKSMTLLTYGGKRTLQVFFWHRLIITCLIHFGLADICMNAGHMGRVLWVLMAVGLSYLCTVKIFRFPTDLMMRASGMRGKSPTQSIDTQSNS